MAQLATMVLAAGKGTRMKSATPKVLHPVCGRPLIEYVLDVALQVGSLKTCVVLGHGIEKVQKHLPKNVLTVEQKKLLGTGDAAKAAGKFLKNFNGDILVLCGDTPLLKAETIKALIKRHRSTKAVATILTAVVDNKTGYGRIIRSNFAKVVAIREESDCTEEEKEIREINSGVFCFNARVLFENLSKIKVNSRKGEYYLTDLIALFAQQRLVIETVTTTEPAEAWGVNTREDLAAAAAIMRQRILSHLMLSGVTIVDPLTTMIDSQVKIGEDSVIKPFTVIDHDVTIGKNCVIGPFAHLRSGTRIDDAVEIGNFAEVSRSTVGTGTFMKHFSFLGDAMVGRNVNIGAGTVTANYDGQEKHRTLIGDGAFIGSDSILVAPVKVGKKAMTGAGSVVTRGKVIPDGKIFVGVPARQVPERNTLK
jgi:bifunctional UDP-N-acetylglucosamine pyrophosphorylase/glucosamine-1-phosphate N-acetyltransferase